MNQTQIAANLLSAALFLMALTTVAEMLIMAQMDISRYRFVNLLRVMRRAYLGAAVFLAAFTVIVVQTTPGLFGLHMFVIGAIIGGMSQIVAIKYQDWASVFRSGVIPGVAVAMSLASLMSNLNLGLPVLIVASCIVLQAGVIVHYRVKQDWITIRD